MIDEMSLFPPSSLLAVNVAEMERILMDFTANVTQQKRIDDAMNIIEGTFNKENLFINHFVEDKLWNKRKKFNGRKRYSRDR
jgi:hypothetical protein